MWWRRRIMWSVQSWIFSTWSFALILIHFCDHSSWHNNYLFGVVFYWEIISQNIIQGIELLSFKIVIWLLKIQETLFTFDDLWVASIIHIWVLWSTSVGEWITQMSYGTIQTLLGILYLHLFGITFGKNGWVQRQRLKWEISVRELPPFRLDQEFLFCRTWDVSLGRRKLYWLHQWHPRDRRPLCRSWVCGSLLGGREGKKWVQDTLFCCGRAELDCCTLWTWRQQWVQ